MRQTNTGAAINSVYNLLWYCCTCIALRVLRYASQFVTLLAAYTVFLTAAIVAFMPPRSFLPPFRFITPRSQLSICFMAGHPFTQAHTGSQGNAPATAQAITTILTGLHCASLRHPITSAAFSPPAANNLARLAATGCVTGLRLHIPFAYAVHATLRPFTVRPSFLTSFYWPPHPVALAGTSVRTSLQCLLRLADAARLQLRLLPAAATALF
jgi:hypothetical protein